MYKADYRTKSIVVYKCKKWKAYSSYSARYLYKALDTDLTKKNVRLLRTRRSIMADIKTHLRELSVATTIGLLNAEIEFKPADLYSSSERFLAYATRVISNDISVAQNLTDYTIFREDLRIIIENGYKLGQKIYYNPYFKIAKDAQIKWLGNDTQKGDPIDVTVGDYGFSLKEESFILKNMGLYQLLNILTGSTYARGLHVFRTFAPAEYDTWFSYTWKSFGEYLKKNISWSLAKGTDKSSAALSGNNVILKYNSESSLVPLNITTNEQFMNYTNSKTREKVFSKWINTVFSADKQYIALKKLCSETAGKKVSNKINSEFRPNNVYDFFQIYPKEYYYAKTTSSETTILKVPGRNDFNSVIKFVGCRYEVPGSQLNIISTFQNKSTGKILEFRNECRFSHGQFNGTPEAKLYVTRDTPLTDLYIPL